jgi:hypothetical protein
LLQIRWRKTGESAEGPDFESGDWLVVMAAAEANVPD